MKKNLITILSFALIALATPARADTTFFSPRHDFEYSLPDSLLPKLSEITTQVDIRIDQFLAQCLRFNSVAACDNVVATANAIIIDDYTFLWFGYLAGGVQWGSVVQVALYRKIGTLTPATTCANGVKLRSAYDMYELSEGDRIWIDPAYVNYWYCGDPNPVTFMPALLHELCHFFRSGHEAGYEECQPLPRKGKGGGKGRRK